MSGPDLVVLGLTLSSSWGNGHATTYRALLRAAAGEGRRILFLERDKPWYSAHRDHPAPDYCTLALYGSVEELASHAAAIENADAVIVGSYVPDGIEVGRFVQDRARGVTAFYDIDTPITLAALDNGDCAYLSPAILRGYDLYLSFTGGPTLGLLEARHGARMARALYCSVDVERYAPCPVERRYDLGYLGTYSDDRQPTLERLLLDVARREPRLRFAVAGPQYPEAIAWPANVERIEHLPPDAHASFYSSCRYTLNVTRADMIRSGWSPSVRLFEAGACATPIISDPWPGLDAFFEPGREIAIAHTTENVREILGWPENARDDMAQRARARVLSAHTAAHRARELGDVIAEAQRRHGEHP